jgi:hypothetical protein
MRLELTKNLNGISLFFEVLVYCWIIANKLWMCFDDSKLKT